MKKRFLCFFLALAMAVLLAASASVTAADAARTPPSPMDWSTASRSFVLEGGYRRSGQSWSSPPSVALHDMDGDGTPELLAWNGASASGEQTASVYVAAPDGLHYAGDAGTYGPADTFLPGSGYPGLYCLSGQSEYYEGVYYTVKDGQVAADPVLTISRDQKNTSSIQYVITQETKDDSLFACLVPQSAARLWDAPGEKLAFRSIEEIRDMGWDGFASSALKADNTLFSDVSLGHWAWSYAKFVCEKGLMTGTGEGIFSPNGVISRAEVATILYRLSGSPRVIGGKSFPDVPSDSWFEVPARWAVGIKIADAPDGYFLPTRTMERQELALILYRYTQYRGYSTPTAIAIFPDWDQVRDDCVEAMYWAVGVGLIDGTGDGRLDPSGTLTRSQLAAVLQRFCSNVLK